MSSPEERARYIQFQLSSLAERNGHHEFEHICRRVAGARIASNLLPASGPVSGGGDQGRDFETHPTELPSELGPHGRFLALASDDPIGFVCTIQRSSLRAKVVGDLAEIAATGPSVKRVHAFVTGSISKAQRAKAIQEAADDHGIELVVHDVLYLAEQLAEPDLYWVAQRYLDAPEEMAPEEPTVGDTGAPAWYLADRERWRNQDPHPTPGDVLDLKDGLRRATFHEHARPDLPFWLDLIRPLANAKYEMPVRQRARYEVAVAVLRGQGTLKPADELVRAYFDDITDKESVDRLLEGSTLLLYVVGALFRGQTAFTSDELREIGEQLRQRVGDLLAEDPAPTRRAHLLWTMGHLKIQLDPGQFEPSGELTEFPDVRELVDEEGNFDPEDAIDPPPIEAFIDLDGAMEVWLTLARELDDATLFPVDRLASMLGVLAPALIDHPGWMELNDRVDVVLGRQAGQNAVAERCRDRALALRKRGRIREAVNEFHRAKVDWWTGDTLRGGLLSLLLLSDCYEQLGLRHAAAEQALAAAFVAANTADEDVQELIPKALGIAALREYETGAFLGACELTELSLLAANALQEGGIDPGDEVVEALLVHAGLTAAAARDLAPCALGPIRDAHERTSLIELLGGDPLDATEGERDVDYWDKLAAEQLAGPPFADLAEEYSAQFAALGIHWTIRASGVEPEAVRAAQRLAAAAQILVVELAEEDLCLIPGSIDVLVAVSSSPDQRSLTERTRWQPTDSGRRWRFELTPINEPVDDPGQIAAEMLGVLSVLLIDASLLDQAKFHEAIERSFERGLANRLMFARPYDEFRIAFVDEELRADIPADCRREPTQQSWLAVESSELGWNGGPGPGYSDDLATDQARARCEKAAERLPRQMSMLRKDAAFKTVVEALRREGWRDHHIVSSVINIAINYRAVELDIDLRDVQASQALMTAPETEDSSLVPAEEFNAEAMENARRRALPAVLKTWGLALHSPTPDLDALEAVLAERYGYWTADAPFEGELLPDTPL
jgi:hypothetical protein